MLNTEVHDDAKDKMKKTMDVLKKDYLGIRTGRATPAILDPIKVNVYGQEMGIKQVAGISVPEPRMIVLQPWDKGVIGEIEKAIQKSDLGINPQSDGKLIRLVFPQLTEERRKELVKVVKKRAEEGKVSVRNIRRESIEFLKEMEKEGEISEDESRRAQDEMQKLTDEFTKEVDKIMEAKEKEIMEI